MTGEEERLARAALCRAVEPGDLAVHARVDEVGAVDAWARLRSRYPEVVPERDLANLERIGGRLVCPAMRTGRRSSPTLPEGVGVLPSAATGRR